MVDDKDWAVNPGVLKALDSGGRENNALNIPGAWNVPLNVPASRRSVAASKAPEQSTLEDIRYARMVLNRIHRECNQLDADIFLHQ